MGGILNNHADTEASQLSRGIMHIHTYIQSVFHPEVFARGGHNSLFKILGVAPCSVGM